MARGRMIARTVLKIGVFAMAYLIASSIVINNAFAANNAEVEDKALASSLIRCYQANTFLDTVSADYLNSPFSPSAMFFMKNQSDSKISPNVGGLTEYFSEKPEEDTFDNCYMFVVRLMEKKNVKFDQKKSNDWEQLGYKKEGSSQNGECITIGFKGYNDGNIKSYGFDVPQQICATKIDETGKPVDVEIIGSANDTITIPESEEPVPIPSFSFWIDGNMIAPTCPDVYVVNNDGSGKSVGSLKEDAKCENISLDNTWDEIKQSINEMMTSFGAPGMPVIDANYSGLWFYYNNGMKTESYGDVSVSYALKRSSTTYKKATKYLIGRSYGTIPSFSNAEIFVTYQNYLKDYFGATVSCEGTEEQAAANGGKTIKFYDGTEIKTCYAYNPEKTDAINGFKGAQFSIKNCDYDCVTNWLANSNVKAEDLKDYTLDTKTGIDTSEMVNEEDAEKECKKNSGALGWILCPIVVGLANVGEKVYGFIEENFLQIRSDVFFSSNSGLNTAWGIFRDIANVAFIILFLIVIFSQLTGVGIDNYGIKKIMPKLIVTVILINLSLIICELAADVSNILGSGLNSLFSDLATKIPVETVKPSLGGSIAAGALAGGGVALFGLLSTGFTGIVAAGLAIILAAVSIVISIVSSMLFLFLILMIRNAGIIILVAIAPVAFVCYMLPNTEGLFKKWVNLFKSLLVVYPICGLLVGGGKLAGNLLASLNTEPMAIAGMIIEVLPFFLIPSILRSSLKLMGNVGARLSSTGRTLGRRGSSLVQQQVRNTDKFKNFSEYNTNRAKARRAQRVVNRLNRRSGGVPENLSERNQEKLLNATKKVNERNQQRGEARAGLAVVNADVVYQEKANERVKQEAKNTVGVAVLNPDTVRQQLENERLKTEVEMEVGVAPISRDNLKQRTQNAFNEAMADTKVPVIPIDQGTYISKKSAEQSSALEKMHTDRYSKMERNQVETSFINALKGNSGEDAAAAMNVLLQKGGTTEVLNALNSLDQNAWNTMDSGVKSYLTQSMGATNVDALKSFSKYNKSGGGATFSDWTKGTGNVISSEKSNGKIKDKTYAQHLIDNGSNAMVGYSKDEMQYVQKNAKDIRTGMENYMYENGGTIEDGKNEFGSMLKTATIKSNDAKVQTVAEETITNELKEGNMEVRNLGLTSEDLGNMRGKAADAIYSGLEQRYTTMMPSITPAQLQNTIDSNIQTQLKNQVAGAKADNRIKSKMSQEAHKRFKIT